MALADYEPERVVIEHKGKPLISVRGLNFNDTSVLVRNHLADLRIILKAYRDQKSLPDDLDIEALVMRLLTDAPILAARMIAIACDEPHGEHNAKQLSVSLQVHIISEIARLTFEDVGGPLAFVGLVARIVGVVLAPSPGLPH